MLGLKFRHLRKSKNKTITVVSSGITSPSSLQRWEMGEGTMSVEKVILLLKRLDIQTNEFFSTSNELKSYTDDINKACQEHDIEGLEKLSKFLLRIYYKDNADKQLLLQAAMACNYYMDFTNVNLLNPTDIANILIYFYSIKESWTYRNVLFFGNTQMLIPVEDVYKISKQLYSYLIDHQEQDPIFYRMSLDALINSLFVLLRKKKFKLAQLSLKWLKEFNISEKYSTEVLRIKYADILLTYLETGNSNQMTKFLDDLESVGLSSTVANFKEGFELFKKF